MLSDFSPKWELKWKGNKNINNRYIDIDIRVWGSTDDGQSKAHDWNEFYLFFLSSIYIYAVLLTDYQIVNSLILKINSVWQIHSPSW